MADIVVQGEHYANTDALYDAIVQLTMKADDMPDGTPEHSSIMEHIEKLKAELPDNFVPLAGDDSGNNDASPEPSPDTPPAEELQEEYTTDIRQAAEGAPLACPLCGSEIPFPEVPPTDPNVEVCPDCQGWGKTITGSRVDGHIWRDCPRCNAQGWVAKAGAQSEGGGKIRAAAAPKWESAVWDSENDWWNPPAGAPPWEGARWDYYEGTYS